ncbi:MAG: hypothetical protein WBV84_14490 [Nitrososphaeraceae archaeon]
MKCGNRQFKLIYTSLIAVLLVAVSSAQLSSVVLSNGTVVYAYSNSQAQSLDNKCGNDGSSGINCANSGPQNIGDDTVTTLTPLQLSNSGKEGPQGPPGPPGPDKVLEKRQTDSNPPPPSLPIVQPGGTSTRSAECNSDEIVTGGGYRISEAGFGIPSFQGATVTDSIPAWTVTITNFGSTLFTFEVFAECVKLVDAP